MSSNKISNVTDPTAAQEAATKNYVDTQLNAFQPLEAVQEASIVNYPGILAANVLTITATGAISVDGITPAANDRILLKDQTTQAQNGVYVVTTVGSIGVSPVLTRAGDYNTAAAVNSGVSIPVLNGATNKLTAWIQTATVVTINVDNLVFTKFSSSPQNVPTAMGTFDSLSPVANGAVIGSSSLYLQSATVANPGLVSSATQNFSGVKSFERIGFNNTSGSSTLWITTSSASLTDPSLTIKAIPSLTGDLLQIFDSSNSPQVIFDSGGNFKFYHNTLSTSRFDVRPSINTSSINSGSAVRYTAFFSHSGNQAIGVGGGIALGGPNNVGTNTTYAAVWCSKDNGAAGDVSASLHLATKNNSTGNFQRAIDIDAGGNTFFAGTIALTGSVSSKVTIQAPSSNTPYSMTLPVSQGSNSWVLQNDGTGILSWANAITNPMTTAGDIVVGSGTGVAARLGIGPAGSVLMSDTTASNSISWQSPLVLSGNKLVNSGFDYWQAALSSGSFLISTVSATITSYTTADQWFLLNNISGSTNWVCARTTGTVLGSLYGLDLQMSNNSVPNDGLITVGQPLDNKSSMVFYGQRASCSVQVRAKGLVNAVNIAAITNTLEAVQGHTVISSATVSVNSATFTQVTLNNFLIGTAHGTAGIVGMRVTLQTVSSGSLNGGSGPQTGMFMEQAQMNVGPVAQSWERQYANAQQELESCLPFFEKIGGDIPGAAYGIGTCFGGTNPLLVVPYKAQKRATGTVSFSAASSFQFRNSTNGFACSVIGVGVSQGPSSIFGAAVQGTIGSAQTANTAGYVCASGTGFIYCDARMG